MLKILLLLLNLSLLSQVALANQIQDEAQQTDASYAELMQVIAQKRAAVLNALNNLNHNEISATAQARLDDFWTSPSVDDAFQTHFNAVEKALANVYIRNEHDVFSIIWSQYKALLDDSNLQTIAKQFVEDANLELKPLQEKLLDDVFNDFRVHADKTFIASQDQAKQDIDKIFAARFENWPNLHANLKPFNADNGDQPTVGGEVIPSAAGAGSLMGAAMLLLSRQIRNILIRQVTQKIAGRVVSKAIPYLGALLLAYDIFNAANAKANMEKTLRDTFFAEYRNMFTPSKLWTASKDTIVKAFNEQFSQWLDANKALTIRLINAAETFNNPHFRAYAKQRQKAGVALETVAAELNELRLTFGALATTAPIETLFEIRAALPIQADNDFLVRMVDAFGSKLLPLYKQYQARLFEATFHIGIYNSKNLIAAGYDLIQVYDQFRRYLDHNSPDSARNGYFIALELDLDLSPPWTVQLFSHLYQYQNVIRRLVTAQIDLPKLKNILSDKVLLNTLQRIEQQQKPLTVTFARDLTLLEMHRYSDAAQLDALLKLYQLQLAPPSTMHAAFNAELQQPVNYIAQLQRDDSVLNIYRRYGAEGVQIWQTYVKPNSGQLQRDFAGKVLTLYQQGYPLEVCLNQSSAEYAHWLSGMPFGRMLFNLTNPIVSSMGIIGLMILTLLMLVLLIPIAMLLLKLLPQAIQRAKNESHHAPIRPGKSGKKFHYNLFSADNTAETQSTAETK